MSSVTDPPNASSELSASALQAHVSTLTERIISLKEDLSTVILGQSSLIEHLLIALIAEGHVLLEGSPGVGKTLAIKALSATLGLHLQRVQCTPDLTPSDILGGPQLTEEGGPSGIPRLSFVRGPIFTELFFADEINRASPRTQSALLEAMAESQVSVEGRSEPLGPPFMLMATQNPIEIEGTYILPEAQADRFMFKLYPELPSAETLSQILTFDARPALSRLSQRVERRELLNWISYRPQVLLADRLKERIVTLSLLTRPKEAPKEWRSAIADGISPRATQDLYKAIQSRALLNGRLHAQDDDLIACALPTLRHRFRLRWEAKAEGITPDQILTALLPLSDS
jgi:MoxR-like ATPase